MDGEGGEEKGRKLNGVGKGKMEQGGGRKKRWKGRRKEKGRKEGKGETGELSNFLSLKIYLYMN